MQIQKLYINNKYHIELNITFLSRKTNFPFKT